MPPPRIALFLLTLQKKHLKMKKFAVILSGCGVYDGSEIHEAVMALYAIVKKGAIYDVYAPDIKQVHVIDHSKGQPMDQERNVMVESARIARGKISPLSKLNPADYDAIVLPGGFGAAKNLSTYAFDGAAMHVLPELEQVLRKMHELKRPIGAMCISPVILAKIFGKVEVTIGQDQGTAAHIESWGAKHKKTSHGEVTVDKTNMLVTTPCYMLDASVEDIARGAKAMVKAMLELM
jgi:enhancing lycopene biosynthesis protein 2